MIKAIAKTTDHDLIVIGLSHENLKRLKAGKPIHFDLKELGIKGYQMFIFAGKTEESMKKELKEQIPAFR